MYLRVSFGRIIEWLIVVALLVTLWPLCSRGDDGQMTAFHGGRYDSQLLLSSGLLAGFGSRTPSLGGTCTGLRYSAEDLYWNPARLGFLNGPQVMLDLNPPLISLNAGSLMDLDGQAAEAVDDLVDEMGGDDLILSPGDYPDIQATVGQTGLVQSAGLACSAQDWSAGVGFLRPLSLELELLGTGLKACFVEPLDEDEELVFSTSADLSLLMNVQVNALTFSLARQLSPRWSLGLAVDRTYGSTSANGRLQTEGIVTLAGHEAAFNDPDADWPNRLYSKVDGSYSGTSWGVKAGASCRLGDNLSLDGTLTLPFTLRMNGYLDITQYAPPPAIDLDADEVLDPDEIDLDEPTRTEARDNPAADEVIIEAPGSIKVGAAWRVSFLTAVLQLSHYWGDLSGHYRIDDDGEAVSYHLGITPTNAFTLGLDLGVVRLSGGLLAGESFYRREPQKEDGQPEITRLVVPTFTLGTGMGLGGGYGIDLLLVSVPSGAMRVTTHLAF
jgi:hypothetical protein